MRCKESESYSSFLRFRGSEAVGIGIFPLPGSNALEVARAVKAQMQKLSANFPPGIKYQLAFNTTKFVEESLSEVIKTLFEAIAQVPSDTSLALSWKDLISR